MNTITIQPPKGLSLKKAKTALKNLNFTIIEEKDPTKMSKEEFKTMLDNAEKTKSEVIIDSKEGLSNLFKSAI